MLSAADQIAEVERHLLRTGGVVVGNPVSYTDPRDEIGYLEMSLEFESGHQLHAIIVLDVLPGWPMWPNYRFHLQDQDHRCVFRYDNAPHFPEMSTFPHHKHVGPTESPEETGQPTIRLVVADVATAVGTVLPP